MSDVQVGTRVQIANVPGFDGRTATVDRIAKSAESTERGTAWQVLLDERRDGEPFSLHLYRDELKTEAEVIHEEDMQDAARRALARELNWDITRMIPVDRDEDGWWYYATDGCRVVGVCVPDDGKFDGYVAEYYQYHVARYGDTNDDPLSEVFTARKMADVEAENCSTGTEDIWAVYDITDIYPRVVAFAHYGTLYVKETRR